MVGDRKGTGRSAGPFVGIFVNILEIPLVGVVPPYAGSALVAGVAGLAGILLVEELDSGLETLGVGVAGVAAVDLAAYAFLCGDGSVALVDVGREENRIAGTPLLGPGLG